MLQNSFKMDEGSTLPDLNNEKNEQIVFKQKVFRCIEVFVRKVNELIQWHKSPTDHQCYPKRSANNQC